VPQLYTFSTVDNGYNFTDPARGDNAQICWPTVASSSLRLYTSDTIPNWNVTFMMATLKGGRFFQIALNGNGTALAQNPVELFHSENRYRDVEFGPDGRTIYVITDSFGAAQALKGGATTDLWTPGSLLMFRMREGRAKLATLFEQISLTLFSFLFSFVQLLLLLCFVLIGTLL
jgi:Glucose / Sorbosone dehydrogenase